jgi:hypothetical protein
MIDLEDLTKQIADAKEKKARAEGGRERLLQQLKADHGCDSVEDARKKIGHLNSVHLINVAKKNEIMTRIEKILSEAK